MKAYSGVTMKPAMPPAPPAQDPRQGAAERRAAELDTLRRPADFPPLADPPFPPPPNAERLKAAVLEVLRERLRELNASDANR
jgi:hypothetical protein